MWFRSLRLVRLMATGIMLALLTAGIMPAQIYARQEEPEGENAQVPRFEKADCRFFTFRLKDRISCGDLIVPENRANPDSRTIKIHVAIIKSDARVKHDDAIIFLDGGPGGHTLEHIDWFAGSDMLYTGRDVIIFDQRGVGLSQPSLDCQEIGGTNYFHRSEDLTIAERNKLELEDIQFCHDRLTARNIDLSGYNTTENAEDVEDLRLVLGYPPWNLFGGSYGTTLGLEILRNHPEGVRSAILVSVAPPETNWIEGIPSSASRAFGAFFNACDTDEHCSEDHPNLENTFYVLVHILNAHPITVTTDGGDIVVHGDAYVNLLFQALYSREETESVASVISAAIQGNHETAARYNKGWFWSSMGFSTGMHYSVICSDVVKSGSYDELRAAEQDFPEQEEVFDIGAYADICKIWDIPQAPAAYHQPVVSDIPVLLLVGQLDPITPPAYAREAAKTLSHSFLYELPWLGHTPLDNKCVQSIMHDFVSTPDQEPDTECIQHIEPLEFQ
ncbi:MAG TPA: alpha/beta fold hydrolase [Phototrophicaceae bacterium]|nr:alpha/beta fold hydrolase [Phototrophicaceae bacterium]